MTRKRFEITLLQFLRAQAGLPEPALVLASALLIGLTWSTAAINARINTRVRAMVAQGLFEEVEGLRKAGRLGPQAAAARAGRSDCRNA